MITTQEITEELCNDLDKKINSSTELKRERN